jgi:uncharacterized membrane protein YeiH
VLHVPIAVELSAVVFGAVSGATHAVSRKADVVGTFSLAMSTGVGGGMLRDILIGVSPPVALSNGRYLPVVAAAAVGAMLFASALARLERAIATVDALLLGLWTVMGTEQALGHQLPVASAIFVGTLTAVGGGAMRDLLSGQTPVILLPGELYATAAFVAAVVYVLVAAAARLPSWVAELATVLTAFVLRIGAMRWHVKAPEPVDLSEWRRHFRVRRRHRPVP